MLFMNALALNHYVNKAGDCTDEFFGYRGGLASSRIQMRPALIAAKDLGLDCTIWSMHLDQPDDLYQLREADLCIVGKLNADTFERTNNLSLANIASVCHLKRKGTKILTLYSDNHLISQDPQVRELYKDLIYLSDTIVCPTELLAQSVNRHSSHRKKIFTIEDPWSLSKFSYKKPIDKYIRIGWFGSGLNIPYLARELTNLFAVDDLLPIPIKFSIVCSPAPLKRLKSFLKKLNINPEKCSFDLIKWDHLNQPNQLEDLLSKSELVLLPSNPKDPQKSGVSHNRLVDAARCGCIPIASPMQSYLELKKIALIGNNFPLMLQYAFKHRTRLQDKYELIRDEILERFSPKRNSQKWQHCLKQVLQ